MVFHFANFSILFPPATPPPLFFFLNTGWFQASFYIEYLASGVNEATSPNLQERDMSGEKSKYVV